MEFHPYLCFEGRCEEAIDFYKEAIGAQVKFMMRFGETPEEGCGTPEKIAHAALKIGQAEMLVSDGRCTGSATFSGTTLSLAVDSDEEAEKKFVALAEGGQILMPLASTFFASKWGVCTDKFGVPWMVLSPVTVSA